MHQRGETRGARADAGAGAAGPGRGAPGGPGHRAARARAVDAAPTPEPARPVGPTVRPGPKRTGGVPPFGVVDASCSTDRPGCATRRYARRNEHSAAGPGLVGRLRQSLGTGAVHPNGSVVSKPHKTPIPLGISDFRESRSLPTTSPRHSGGAVRADAESCRRPDDRSTDVDRQEWRTQARRVAGRIRAGPLG